MGLEIVSRIKSIDLSIVWSLIRSFFNTQTGYVEGSRFIGENTRLISDILYFTAGQI